MDPLAETGLGSDEFPCGACERWFASPGAARQHRSPAHGRSLRTVTARECCLSCICPALGGDFRSRIRALRALPHGAQGCVAACRDGLLPVHAPELAAAADERDPIERAWRRKLALQDVAGLLRHRAGSAVASAGRVLLEGVVPRRSFGCYATRFASRHQKQAASRRSMHCATCPGSAACVPVGTGDWARAVRRIRRSLDGFDNLSLGVRPFLGDWRMGETTLR